MACLTSERLRDELEEEQRIGEKSREIEDKTRKKVKILSAIVTSEKFKEVKGKKGLPRNCKILEKSIKGDYHH